MISALQQGLKLCIALISLHGSFENHAQRSFCYSKSLKIMHSLVFVTLSKKANAFAAARPPDETGGLAASLYI